MVVETLALQERIRRELPSLNDEQAQELACIVERLVVALHPERIYAFGSRARDDAHPDSDVDLMVIVPDSTESSYWRIRHARDAVRPRQYLFSLDILVWTRDEFEERLPAVSSLPATVADEGKLLYAA